MFAGGTLLEVYSGLHKAVGVSGHYRQIHRKQTLNLFTKVVSKV